MPSRASALSILALAASLGACASTGGSAGVAAPNTTVALADYNDSVFRSIAVSEVSGAAAQDFFADLPWSENRAPSQTAVKRMVDVWLADADMLASDNAHARYFLKVSMEGAPPVQAVAAKDEKRAASLRSVTYSLLDARTGAVVLEKSYEADPSADPAATAPPTPPRAPRALISSSFNDFVVAMSEENMLRVRRAVPCDVIDPGHGLGPAVIHKTADAVGVDCPV